MGSWFVDIFLEYLFRVVVSFFKARGTGAWPLVKATVMSSACPTAVFGCPVAEIYYKYVADGELYTGAYERPFILVSSAKDYISQMAPGAGLSVRLNPKNPAASVVLERDQTFSYTVDSRTL